MSFKMVEYDCPDCGRYESLEHRPPPSTQVCPGCGETAELVISAPLATTPIATVVRGSVAPPPSPYATDCTAVGRKEIGWGEHYRRRDAQLAELRRKEIKERLK